MKRILVVDDEYQVRKMLRQTLERSGFEVVEASDGKEALKHYHADTIDLVITDIIMPDKEGIETIIDLRKINPNVKIFAISGGGKVSPGDYLILAGRSGAMRTFTKPLDREEILVAIKEALGNNSDN